MTQIALNIMISNPLTTVTYHVLLAVVACLAAELVPALVSVLPLASCRGGARANPAHLQETRAAALCFDFFHRNPRNLIFAIERTLLSLEGPFDSTSRRQLSTSSSSTPIPTDEALRIVACYFVERNVAPQQ